MHEETDDFLEILEYRHRLYDFLSSYHGAPVLLKGVDQDTLKEVLFNYLVLEYTYEFFEDSDDFYSSHFFDNYKHIDMKVLYRKIDFSNIDFDRFKIRDTDFTGLFGVYINPLRLKQHIENVNFDGVTFTNGFDNYHHLENVRFKGSKNARIDPNKNFLFNISFADVTFLCHFRDLRSRCKNNFDFTGSHRAIIEPNVQITDSILYDATLIGDLTNERFINCTPPIEKIREVYGTDKEMVLVRKEDFR